MSEQPWVLDLYCCEGGAGTGYHRADLNVIGVDSEPQPRYPFTCLQYDALAVLKGLISDGCFSWLRLRDFAAIHASPPCQDHSATQILGGGHGTGWMLLATRELLPQTGLPWVLENVAGSPVARQDDLFGANGLELCGCMFPELRGQLYEDRWFETSFPVRQPRHLKHLWPQTKMGRTPIPGECMQLTGHFTDADEGRRRIGMPWASRDGIAQAIPPAYTEYVGAALLEHIRERAA